jgi:hypothetical protein
MSRSAVTIVLLVFAFSGRVAARDTATHVRGLDAWANESLERGIHSSVAVRDLLRTLAASDVIVHVESSTTLSLGFAGITRFVADTGEYRYVRITLARALNPDARAATLAHELQHAVELAGSDVRSHTAMFVLFERIGFRLHGKRPYYETVAAQRAGARAWAELRGYHVAAAEQE